MIAEVAFGLVSLYIAHEVGWAAQHKRRYGHFPGEHSREVIRRRCPER